MCEEEGHVFKDCPQLYANVGKSQKKERITENKILPQCLTTAHPAVTERKGVEKIPERVETEGENSSKKESLIRSQENMRTLKRMVEDLEKKEQEKDLTGGMGRRDKQERERENLNLKKGNQERIPKVEESTNSNMDFKEGKGEILGSPEAN